jgi:glycosyltransferase involved in cell wall biosynthesis
LACYNQKDFIAEALSSALEQDYENLEVIVSDDHSTDGTQEIIKAYLPKYPNRLIANFNEENLGITGNCNKALSMCQGKYIALFAGDDIYLPRKISKQVEKMESDDGISICYHDVEVFDTNKKNASYLYSEHFKMRQGGIKEMLKYGVFACALSIMLRKDVIPSHGFNNIVKNCSDMLICMEVLMQSKCQDRAITFIPGVYARHRRHDNNITNKSQEYGLDEYLKILDYISSKNINFLTYINKQKAELFFLYGISDLRRGKFKYAAKKLFQSILTSPQGFIRGNFLLVMGVFKVKIKPKFTKK